MTFNNEDILTLAKAGFTAQQIAALSVVQAAPAPAPTPVTPTPAQALVAPAPDTPALVAPAPAPAPAAPAPAAPQASIESVLASINGLSQQMQQGFIQQTQQPMPAKAEDILAEIINPPMKK